MSVKSRAKSIFAKAFVVELSRCEERRSELVSDCYYCSLSEASSLDGPSTDRVDGLDGMGRSSRDEAGSLGEGISPPLEPWSFPRVLPHLIID